MFHNRITHDGLNPAPAARMPAPDIADDATQRERRMHAAGVGFGALCVVLPALLALVYYVRVQPDPTTPDVDTMVTTSGGRVLTVTTWSLLSILGALAAGWVLAGAVRCKGRTGAVRMLLTFAPAAAVGAITLAIATALGVSGDARLRMAAMSLLVIWCALALASMLRATRGYTRRHTRTLALTAAPLLLISVPLAYALPLLPTVALAFATWTLLTASAVWHPRERTTPPLGDQYAQEQLARLSPAKAEHLRFPLHQRR